MKIQILFRLITVSLLILFLQSFLQGQVNMDKEFSKLPEDVRDELFHRIDQFVEKTQNEKWEEVYDFYWKQYIDGVNGLNKKTKEEYVKQKTKLVNRSTIKLVGFTPLDVKVVSFENEKIMVVIIEGCGEYQSLQKENRIDKVHSSVTAVWEDNSWYFTDIAQKVPCFDCYPKVCASSK